VVGGEHLDAGYGVQAVQQLAESGSAVV